MTHTIDTSPPARDSREYQIIRTLLTVDSKGKAQGDDFKALMDVGIDVAEQLSCLFIDLDRDGVFEKMSMGQISSNAFHIAVLMWANGTAQRGV